MTILMPLNLPVNFFNFFNELNEYGVKNIDNLRKWQEKKYNLFKTIRKKVPKASRGTQLYGSDPGF